MIANGGTAKGRRQVADERGSPAERRELAAMNEAEQARLLTAALGLEASLFPLPDAVVDDAREGRTVQAVKGLRQHASGRLSLVQAHRLIQALER